MASNPDTPSKAAPSGVQVALAIAILRSKPKDITVRNYVQQLRSYLRAEHRTAGNDNRRHLDSVMYWKDQYEVSEEKCRGLEHRITQLERANDALQSRQNVESVHTETSSKRKRGVKKQAKTSKRSKVSDNISDPFAPATQDMLAVDSDVLDPLGEAGTKLTQSLYLVYKLFKQNSADTEPIYFGLIETARAIGDVISTASKRHERPVDQTKRPSTPFEMDNSELSSVIRASARAFTSLLVGLKRVSDNDVENRLTSFIIFECVKMFRTILDSIGVAAHATAAARLSSSTNYNANRPKASVSTKESNPSRTIAQFVNAIVAYLNKSDPIHREIFEGFLFILLEQVGKRLYYCVFGRNRNATLRADIALPPNDHLPAVAARNETESLAVKLEALALIAILERAIALAPYHLNARTVSSSSTSSRTNKSTALAHSLTSKALPTASKVPLSMHAKERLQRTLINCMWGEEEQDEFSDALRMPARLGGLPNVPKMNERDVGDWFEEEVWRLVGLDLLESRIQW
ncbi:hypothetical protein CC78DRAFT_564477 [Lojkania enalia]|uniref:Uncharacterized protein n=1 Tax=Lojkania enalia TaxID=147567 RepID=A0A9P4NAS6_9PLEO|nr:hypothetical protein CC78DRAFT_564477 [Didymosphaeria enalia]